jgi:hypothetical protein
MFRVVFAVVFYFLYWLICYLNTGTDKKNLLGLRSYPTAVQEKVRHDSPLADIAPKAQPIWMILLSNLVVFSVVFGVLGLLLKEPLDLTDYGSAFVYLLVLGEGLGLFDLVVIDLLWWRNTKRIRFSFLPEKAIYQDPHQHLMSFVRGIPLFAAIAALGALIVML